MYTRIRDLLDEESGGTGRIELMLAQDTTLGDAEVLHQLLL